MYVDPSIYLCIHLYISSISIHYSVYLVNFAAENERPIKPNLDVSRATVRVYSALVVVPNSNHRNSDRRREIDAK